MPPLQINIKGTFEKSDLYRVAPFASDTIIAAALLSPLNIEEQDLISLITDANCETGDAIQIMRQIRKLLGRRVNHRSMRAYRVVEEFGQAFLDNQRQNHR